jgi:hypothetical protein
MSFIDIFPVAVQVLVPFAVGFMLGMFVQGLKDPEQ